MSQLLAPHEPSPVEIHNPDGQSDFVVICEHAGRRIPEALGNLGLQDADLTRHIAWDIGARDIAIALADRLDAPLFMQRYSRLVCDCNRQPDVDSFIPRISEATIIPGNSALSESDRAARISGIFQPFHDTVSKALDQRSANGQVTFMVTIHSFTPVFNGVSRPWEIGVLYNRDKTLSPAMLGILQADTEHCVGDNQPYSVGDDTDYTIPVFGEARGIPCVEIEIRNDLTEGVGQVNYWADLLTAALRKARARLSRD